MKQREPITVEKPLFIYFIENMTKIPNYLRAGLRQLTAVGLFLILIGSPTVWAASSAWFKTDGAQIRLIALPSPDGKIIQAGLQINLEKGWKTYWRAPGSSGLPPQIDLSASKNIASSKIDYPVPTTFGEKNNLTAGYTAPVTFPITIEPLFANRPVTVNASGIIGVCSTVCVPVQFKLSLSEDGKGVSTPEVASALLTARQNPVAPPREDFKVKSIRLAEGSTPTLDVTAIVPTDTQNATLFVEGPESWYLTPAHAVSVKNGRATFQIQIASSANLSEPEIMPLRLTLVANGSGIEQSFDLKK